MLLSKRPQDSHTSKANNETITRRELLLMSMDVGTKAQLLGTATSAPMSTSSVVRGAPHATKQCWPAIW